MKHCLPEQLQGHLYVPYLPVKQLYAHQQSDVKNSTISNGALYQQIMSQLVKMSDLYLLDQ